MFNRADVLKIELQDFARSSGKTVPELNPEMSVIKTNDSDGAAAGLGACHSLGEDDEPKRRTRFYEEIEQIEGFELMSLSKIWVHFHDVDKHTSCVTEVNKDSIKWIDGKGGVQETTRKALEKWLQRHPKRKAIRT